MVLGRESSHGRARLPPSRCFGDGIAACRPAGASPSRVGFALTRSTAATRWRATRCDFRAVLARGGKSRVSPARHRSSRLSLARIRDLQQPLPRTLQQIEHREDLFFLRQFTVRTVKSISARLSSSRSSAFCDFAQVGIGTRVTAILTLRGKLCGSNVGQVGNLSYKSIESEKHYSKKTRPPCTKFEIFSARKFALFSYLSWTGTKFASPLS